MNNIVCQKWRPVLTVWMMVTLTVSQSGFILMSVPPALAGSDNIVSYAPSRTLPPPQALPPPPVPGESDVNDDGPNVKPAAKSTKPLEGLDFKLSEGKSDLPAATTNPVVNAQVLSEEETSKLLKLLPPLDQEKLPAFLLPGHSLPPPNTQHKIEEPFPPSHQLTAPPRTALQPLTIQRKRPIGSVDHASTVSVTFSQPMVPVSSQATIEAKTPPITLTPAVDGEWKWYGTQTLTFEPKDKRLPMATAYTVKVPEGTKSALGSQLAKDAVWNFSTAPTMLTSHYPSDQQTVAPKTLIMARFNQKVDKDAILAVTKISTAGHNYSAVAATDAEIASDPVLVKLLKNVPNGAAVIFKSAEPLPFKSSIVVSIGPGAKSAEGPLTRSGVMSFIFRTYGPMTLLPQTPDDKTPGPAEYEQLNLRFTNVLDPKTVSASSVKVTPPIPDAIITSYGEVIAIQGEKRPLTKYRVELSDKIHDRFGQSLSGTMTRDFNVKAVDPQLHMLSYNAVLSSKKKTLFSFTTVNLSFVDVKVYAVDAKQYSTFATGDRDFLKHQTVLRKERLHIKNRPNDVVITELDLAPWLSDGRGSLVVAATDPTANTDTTCWVQCTNLGLTAFDDGNSVLAWATDLLTGAPIKDAKVAIVPGGPSSLTDSNGLARLSPPKLKWPATVDGTINSLIATHGKDVAIVSETYRPFAGAANENTLNWYVVTDRSPYRPNETVRVKGIIRKRKNKPDSDLSIPKDLRHVSYVVNDNQGNQLIKAQTDFNTFGAFDLSFKLPEHVNLGDVILNLTADGQASTDGADYQKTIPVAEFRRPEFQLKVKNEGDAMHEVGCSALLSASTDYYAGGHLSHTKINWRATATRTSYNPPGWSEFDFGHTHMPWFDFGPNESGANTQTMEGTTDGNGKHYLRVDFLGVHPPAPSLLEINATVQDVNRQTWTDSTSLVVHPSKLYAGTKIGKSFIEKGGSLPLTVIVTDIDGKAKENTPVKIQIWRSTYDNNTNDNDKRKEKKDDLQDLSITSGAKPVELNLQPHLGGLYKICATVVDASGHPNETETMFWVAGGELPTVDNREAVFQLQKALLIPEKTDLKPGDQSTILVQSPFAPAEGLATIWHNGILSSIPFKMKESTYKLHIPITEKGMPSIKVAVDLVGTEKNNAKLKSAPAEASGSVDLNVSTDSRKLTVEAKPDPDKTEPGKDISIDLHVADNSGHPVANADVTVAVVDEALLALTGYNFTAPLSTFYTAVNDATAELREREHLDLSEFLKDAAKELGKELTGKPKQLALHGLLARPRAGGGGGGSFAGGSRADFAALPPPSALPPPPMPGAPTEAQSFAIPKAAPRELEVAKTPAAQKALQIRSNFDALAKWAPSVVTDETGHAVVKLKLPDNLTRYRIMVVAAHGADLFGTGESSLTARLPLMAKPSAPRFLNYGDKFELPVVIQNQTDSPLEVNLAARATNCEFTSGQGRYTTVPANDRVEVRLPASTVHSGNAKFQVIVASGETTDAAEFNLPVYTPATSEAFATYGQIDKGAVQQMVETPEDVIADSGALEVTTSTTVLETLTDAFLYLHHYPFECSEQLSSRLISVALLKDMLSAFHAANIPSEDEIRQSVTADLAKLQSRQKPNGSFALWSSSEPHTYPYVTLHVAHALILAKVAGYDVPKPMLDKTLAYLKHIESYLSDYKGTCKIELKALALYLRDLAGDSDIQSARILLKEQPMDDASLETLAFLLQVFSHNKDTAREAASINTYMTNLLVETASTAQIVRHQKADDVYDYRMFDSPMRLNAIVLDALISNGSSPDIVAKLLRSVLGGQVKGRWGNTQENVYVLLAMRHYFDRFEKVEPDLVAQAWLGKDFIGESSFKGRTNDFKTIRVPMSYLAEHPRNQEFIIKKTGDGRLYYRLGMNYAPKSLKLQSMDRGFSVERSYGGAVKQTDVTRDSDGTWHFKSGSLVKVKLKISAPAERFFVALVDPIPAGVEILNEELKGAEKVKTPAQSDTGEPEASDSTGSWLWGWWHFNWWTHENKRDNQTEVFADQLQGGAHEYSYFVRATTPGTFVVPPTKAEEMYAPETFGRAHSESVVIQ